MVTRPVYRRMRFQPSYPVVVCLCFIAVCLAVLFVIWAIDPDMVREAFSE